MKKKIVRGSYLAVLLLSGVAWAGPYEVRYSSAPACNHEGMAMVLGCGQEYHDLKDLTCVGDKNRCEWIYDLAHALNKAHEERTEQHYFIVPPSIENKNTCPEKGCHE